MTETVEKKETKASVTRKASDDYRIEYKAKDGTMKTKVPAYACKVCGDKLRTKMDGTKLCPNGLDEKKCELLIANRAE